MKLNITSQHAIRIMTFIAEDKKKLHHAKNISEELSIPYKYLTKIMTQLVASKLINSIRGREGGYTIAEDISSIKISDILMSVNESLNSTECILGTGKCDENKQCALHDKWKAPKKAMLDMFQKTTLKDLKSQTV